MEEANSRVTGLMLCKLDVLLFKHLTVMNLSNNNINEIPPELGRMPCLAELHLGNNQLGATRQVDWRWMFGPEIARSLKLLDLTSNKLTNLPNAIWRLQSLVTLHVDNNQLTTPPAALTRISSLRYLSVSRNKLEHLPGSLMQRKLEKINISSNNFFSEVKRARPSTCTAYQFFVGNLVQCAAKIVLKNNHSYASNIIPYTLVEFLDSANMCVCGNPVMNDYYSMIKFFDPKEFFGTVISDAISTNMVKFECFFCSCSCYIFCIKTLIIFQDNFIRNNL